MQFEVNVSCLTTHIYLISLCGIQCSLFVANFRNLMNYIFAENGENDNFVIFRGFSHQFLK
jgi:hypothetical protein